MVAYCNFEDVSGEAQRVQPFSATTKPTSMQVQTIIDGVAAKIDLAIHIAGYVLPIMDESTLRYLSRVNAIGAAAATERASIGRGSPEAFGKDTLYNALWTEFNAELKFIMQPGSLGDLPQLADTGSPASLWTDHILDGSDPNYSSGGPWFTRDAFRER